MTTVKPICYCSPQIRVFCIMPRMNCLVDTSTNGLRSPGVDEDDDDINFAGF